MWYIWIVISASQYILNNLLLAKLKRCSCQIKESVHSGAYFALSTLHLLRNLGNYIDLG